jgi:Tol biopolymer transport system component
MHDQYDAFISYRRQYDSQTARLLLEALDDRGFNVFLDVEGLRTGRFDNALLERIAGTPHFIVILSDHSLDRCVGEGDWFCREIAQAIKSGKNIVPVLMPGFEFPPASKLLEEVRPLSAYNGVRYSHEFYEAAVEKIINCMQQKGGFGWFRRRPLHRFSLWVHGLGRPARASLLALTVLTLLAAGAYLYLRPAPRRYIRIEGSSPKYLTGLAGQETAPAFSPHGGEVVYVSDHGTGKFDLYVKLLNDDASPLPLTETDAVEHSPAWSPAGNYIAYLREPSDPQEAWGFYKVTKNGGEEVRIADAFSNRYFGGRIEGRSISWAKDGEHLAVMDKQSAAEPFRIYLIPAGPSSERVPLTDPKVYPGDCNPAFSPDGQTLAFTRAASTGSSNIYLLRMKDGRPDGDPVPVTNHNKWVADLAWTPDGSSLIFSTTYGGTFNLWMLPAAQYAPDVKPRALGGLGQNLLAAAVSSKWELAFSHFKDWDIDILQFRLGQKPGSGAAFAGPLQATPGWEISPHFSLNGEKISFASDHTGSREVYVYELKGSKLLKLTKFGGADTGSPRLSPDGTRVVFDTEEKANRDIYVVRAARQESPTPLVTDPSLDVRPSWSADGKWVYFGSDRTKEWQVWKVAAAGGTPEQVTKRGGREAFASPDGEFIYYAKDMGDHWELWRVPTQGGDETPVLAHVRQGFWAVTRKGIYHLAPEGTVPLTIDLYRFDTKTDEPTGVKLDREPGTNAPGLAVSPDDGLLLIQQEVKRQSNVMVAKLTGG